MNYATKFIGKEVEVEIDRPLLTKHPKHEMIYKLNYGFVPGTEAPDGEGIDVYILDIDKPISKCTGTCIGIIQRKDDDDDKLLVVTGSKKYSDKEILDLVNFQEKYFDSKIIRGE